MDRVFVDANVLFSAAYDPTARIAGIFNLPDTELVTSGYAASEAIRNIDAKKPDRLPELLDMLRRIGLVDDVPDLKLPQGINLSTDDQPILQAAIASRANFLITGDKDFRLLFGRVIEGVLVIRPGDYLRLRGG